MNQITLCVAIVLSLSWLGQASPQTSVDSDPRFLAVDVLGAWNRYVVTAAEVAGDDRVFHGWAAGATVRYSKPWFGIRADVGRTARGEERINHLLIGPQLTTPYGSVSGVRVFAHALVGRAFLQLPTASSSALELVVGGGVQGLVHVEFGYVRRDLHPSIPEHDGRLLVGAVVPLCFSRCENGWSR